MTEERVTNLKIDQQKLSNLTNKENKRLKNEYSFRNL